MNENRVWVQKDALAIAMMMIGVFAAVIIFLSIRILGNNSKAEWVEVESNEQYDIALHEAGHAIVSYLVQPKRKIDKISLKTERRKDSPILGEMTYDKTSSEKETIDTLDADTLVDYAGEIAEEALLGNAPYTESSDFKHAKKNLYERLRKLCKDSAVCKKLLTDERGKTKMMKKKVTELEDKSRERAKKFIEANSDAVKKLANKLMLQPDVDRQRTLGQRELYIFLSAQTFVNPEKKAEQKEDVDNEQCTESPNQPVPGVLQYDAGARDRPSP